MRNGEKIREGEEARVKLKMEQEMGPSKNNKRLVVISGRIKSKKKLQLVIENHLTTKQGPSWGGAVLKNGISSL